jgi:hypothetical protein
MVLDLYATLDNNNVITCIASLECNLHQRRIDLGDKVVLISSTMPGYDEMVCGDRYDPDTKQLTVIPANHTKPTIEELAEIQIQAEMRRLAISNLKTKGTLPSDFVDSKAVEEKPIPVEEP